MRCSILRQGLLSTSRNINTRSYCRYRKAGEGEKKQREKGNNQVFPHISPVLAPGRTGTTGLYWGAAWLLSWQRWLQAPGPTGHSLCFCKKCLKSNQSLLFRAGISWSIWRCFNLSNPGP